MAQKNLFNIFIDALFNRENNGTINGYYGEHLVQRELNLVKLFGRKGEILRNIYIPKEDGETTEVDVVFITVKGIFVIESKNYSGWIFGDEKSYKWTAMLPNKIKNKFYNPIKQNDLHIEHLRKYLDMDIPFFSIIAFSERCELKKIKLERNDVFVIKRDYLYSTIRKIWKTSKDSLSENEVVEVYNKLKKLTNVDKSVALEHIKNIKKKIDV